MGNPARELADQLDSWKVGVAWTPEAARGDSKAESSDFWARHLSAVRAINDIERMADRLDRQNKDTGFIRKIIPQLYQAVFAVTTPWGTQGDKTRTALSLPSTLVLRAFASLFDEYDLEVDLDQIQALKSGLTELEQLVLEIPPRVISRNNRIYLLGLIEDALVALEDPMHDGGRLARTATHAVTGAITAQLPALPVTPAPAGAKSLRQRITDTVKTIAIASALAFGGAYADDAAESAWQLTESALSQVLGELAQSTPDDGGAPEIGPAPARLELPPAPPS